VTRLAFLVLPSAYSQLKTPAPIYTINISNYAVSRKNVPFGVSKTQFYISTPFSPKNAIFRQFSTYKKSRVKKALTMGC